MSFHVCSNCGAGYPAGAKACPKCWLPVGADADEWDRCRLCNCWAPVDDLRAGMCQACYDQERELERDQDQYEDRLDAAEARFDAKRDDALTGC